MELLTAIDITKVTKWIVLVAGVLDLVIEFLTKGDLSVGAIIAVAFSIVMFVVNSLQNKAAVRLGVKK